MVGLVLALAILTGPAASPRPADARELLACQFEEKWDQNFDLWPDGWSRRHGEGFPNYLKIEIDAQRPPCGGQSLRMELDGGGAVAYSGPVTISPRFGCVAEVWVKTAGLKQSAAFLSLDFLDERDKPLETFQSERTSDAGDWQRLYLGPIVPSSSKAGKVLVGLHLEPATPGKRGDFKGMAWFGGVWLGRVPRIVLETNSRTNIYQQGEPIEVRCTASGFDGDPPRWRISLKDAERQVGQSEQELKLESPGPGEADSPWKMAKGVWQSEQIGPGLYWLGMSLVGPQGDIYSQEVLLSVLAPLATPPTSPFGWNLAQGDKPLGPAETIKMLTAGGVRRVKYPLWFPGADPHDEIERFVAFSERLQIRGIEQVGVLDPPREVASRLGETGTPVAADVFGAANESWIRDLEPIIARLASTVRSWQLGTDRDTSFVGFARLSEQLDRIRSVFAKWGAEANLGVPWGWLEELPRLKSDRPGQFVSLVANPPLTPDELAAYLQATQKTRLQRWVVLQPLDREYYSAEVRAKDLVRQMVEAKVNKADAVYLTDPFDARAGLFDAEGRVGELFIPWRTAALVLGPMTYLGQVDLPNRSTNYLFAQGDQAVMVLWGEHPCREKLYLGKQARQIDLWGYPLQVEDRDDIQTIQSLRRPTFVLGISAGVAKWRMAFELARDRVPSIFHQAHENSFKVRNTFAERVTGRVQIVAPENWNVMPRQMTLQMAPGETVEQKFEIRLPGNAAGGRHPLRFQFEIQADTLYKFSVYRQLDVGLGEVYLEVRSQLNRKGDLEVQQWLYNSTGGKVSFRCQLFAPDRARQQTDVMDLPPGHDVKTYLLPKGSELMGRTLWIRAEELGGRRTLNHQFVAER